VCSNPRVRETPEEIDRLQVLLDRSAAGAGGHLRGILSEERRLSAARLCERLQGMRLLTVATVTAERPSVSATHLPGEELAVTVHGRAELFDLASPDGAELRQAMLDHYLPLQGPQFETWLDELDAVGARIEADKMFTFALDD